MKKIVQTIVAASLLSTINHLPSSAFAQGTAFTYQGLLQNNGGPVSGAYNLQFTLYTTNGGVGTVVGGPVTNNAVAVSNGLFTVTIDFGNAAWNGETNWLQIGVESNGASSFAMLSPLQQLTPVPYSIYAESANAAQLSGVLNLTTPEITSGGSTILYASNNVGNFFIGPNAGNPANDSGQGNTAGGFNALTSNTIGNDNTAFGVDALVGNTNGSFNTAIGYVPLALNTIGSYNNAIGYGALYHNASGSNNVANGYDALDANVNGSGNTAEGMEALFSCTNGNNNTAVGDNALSAFYVNPYSSCSNNTADGYFTLESDTLGNGNVAVGYQALWQLGITNGAVAAGGNFNIAVGYLAGVNYNDNESSNIDIGNPGVQGENNVIRIGSGQSQAFIAGNVGLGGVTAPQQTLSLNGGLNIDQASLNFGSVYSNALTFGSASGEGFASRRTSGTGQYSLDFYTAFIQRMIILQDGNVGIGNTNPADLLVVGNSASPAYCNGTTWQNGSDRNSKQDFAAINPREVLEKVDGLPITEWRYKVDEKGLKHIGPMAQDFHAAFDLNGPDDKHIATVDEGGVALAAIQGLNQKVDAGDQESGAKIQKLEADNTKLSAQVAELRAQLSGLQKVVAQLSAGSGTVALNSQPQNGK